MRYGSASLLIPALMFMSCAEGGGGQPTPDRIEGVLVDIESAGIGEVSSFTIKDGSETYEVFIASDVEYGFPLGHLQEHLQAAEPVGVDLEERDGRLYALTIDDL